MSRRRRLQEYARILGHLAERSKTDPVGLERDLRRYLYLRTTAILLCLCLSLVFTHGLEFLLQDGLRTLQHLVSAFPNQSAAILACTGILLYLFRRISKYYYGILEISFAYSLINVAVYRLPSGGFPELLALGNAIYVLVRGIDNTIQGFESPRLTVTKLDSQSRPA